MTPADQVIEGEDLSPLRRKSVVRPDTLPDMAERLRRAVALELIRQELSGDHDEPAADWMVAKAVLEALREPTPQMVEAMFKRWRSGPDYSVRDAIASMFAVGIDAALSQSGEG